ncbi:MAG: neutral zinc metallopeptidase [Geodermatophilaceae bacterium]|nr:neutral zinc metallopeptidase [Geodermatophilaceae bacterium]
MTFSEGVKIDPGRESGGRGGGRRGGIAIGGGGGLIVVLLALLLGINPGDILGGGNTGTGDQGQGSDAFAQCTNAEAANTDINCRVIATAESLDAVWAQLLPDNGGPAYVQPGLNIFAGSVNTGCGAASSATGPFYCPTDQSAYFDSDFFDLLETRFGANGGPLAQEYVVAHEFGHHIQNQLGLLNRAQQDPQGPESGSVRTELMADCLAGMWAKNASTVPDPDTGTPFLQPLTDQDIADALSAAAAVGDDRIQSSQGGQVNPESFTHGTSEQRQRWFRTGFERGTVEACNTFDAADL